MELFWPASTAQMNLTAEEAHLWAVRLDRSTQSTDSWATLSAEERLRAERYRLDAPRQQFVSSRSALRLLLGSYLGISAADVELTTDANGKPRLHGAKESTELRFNLAHSGDLALVALTRDCEVGVDIEQLRDVGHMEQIARRYFHDAEVEEILAVASDRRSAAFLGCWTAKEAILKAIGTGLSGEFYNFLVPVNKHDGAWVNVPVTGSTAPVACWVQHLTPSDKHVGAVAFVGSKPRVLQFTLCV